MTSRIILQDIKIYAYHGVLPEENLIGTWYLINAEIETDLWKAADSDKLADSVSYADINEIIHREMAIPSQLLEHVAGRIMQSICRDFPQISTLLLTVIKTNPPMRGECKGAGVQFYKDFRN